VEDARIEWTRLLERAGAREDAWREVFPLVLDELRAMAARRMEGERKGHTLQATALVHEVWLRLFANGEPELASRRHFFAAASRAMQEILTDHARRALARKRGGEHRRLTLSGVDIAGTDDPRRALEVADAVDRLEKQDPRAAEVARLRLFAGIDVAGAARVVGASERTAAREWAYARARLTQLLGEGGGGEEDRS
jgi:RNA polymerase sigma factor (TIGR02999 family)